MTKNLQIEGLIWIAILISDDTYKKISLYGVIKMGLRMRKSISICKGVRLNVGKKGVGLSFGTKGLRYSINSSGRRTTTIGMPGTGISYSTSSGGSRRNYSSNAYYTRQQLQIQKQQQKFNEIQQNTFAVNEYTNLIEIIKGVHRECDEFVDWVHISSL